MTLGELTCLEAAVGLWFAHLFCQMGTAGGAFSTACLFSSRDEQEPPKGLPWGRATRAFANYVENLVAFVALDLALIVTHHTADFAPTVWIAARVVYLPYIYSMSSTCGRSPPGRDDQPPGDAVGADWTLIAERKLRAIFAEGDLPRSGQARAAGRGGEPTLCSMLMARSI